MYKTYRVYFIDAEVECVDDIYNYMASLGHAVTEVCCV